MLSWPEKIASILQHVQSWSCPCSPLILPSDMAYRTLSHKRGQLSRQSARSTQPLQYGRRRNANALPERGRIELIEPILAIISEEKLLIFQPKWVIYMSKNIFCLIETYAQISNSLFHSVKLSTLYSALNLQCLWKMTSIKRILQSYPWKNSKKFNGNRSFTCPTLHFAWLKLAFWSRKTPNTVLNFWLFCRQSTLDASQTWLPANEYFAHIRGKIINISTEIGYLHVQKYILID